MKTYPILAEQFFNEKLVLQVLEIRLCWGSGYRALVRDDKFGVALKSEAVVEAVETVMDRGEKGVERRKRARELGKRAMEEGGSSFLNVRLLIQNVIQQINDKSTVIV